jgi:acyl CoA:acetate/3-ketoacid CoA transferase beta subunit
MHHTTGDGTPKILTRCTLPLTAPHCVSRVVTDIAVMDIEDGRILLRAHAPGWDADQIQAVTEAPLVIADDLHEIALG